MSEPETKPRYRHDWKMDLFIGQFEEYDIYAVFNEYSYGKDPKFPEGYYGSMLNCIIGDDIRKPIAFIRLYELIKADPLYSAIYKLLIERNLIFASNGPNRTACLFLSKDQIIKELSERKLKKFSVEVTRTKTWTETVTITSDSPESAEEKAETLDYVVGIRPAKILPDCVSDIFDVPIHDNVT